MATRWRATAVVLVLTLLPLTGVLGSALLALVVLRHGLREGLLVAAIAALAFGAADLLLGGSAMRVAALLAVNWLPVIVLAAVLARTVSLPRTLNIAVVAGIALVASVFVGTGGDPAPAWERLLTEQVLPLMEEVGVPLDRTALEAALPQMAVMMTGMAAAFWAIGHFITVLLARWWQAILVNPGGFREEFHRLRAGVAEIAVGGVVFLAATLTGMALLGNVALVVLLGFAVVGLAVMHGVVGRAGMNAGWLVPPYLFLVFLPPYMLALLAVMGFVDYWIDFRGRISNQTNG